MKTHEQWWQKNLPEPESMDTDKMGKAFRYLMKSVNAPSRKFFRQIITDNGYRTMLECAAGLCIDYQGIIENKIKIDYSAIEITPKLVQYNRAKGISIKQASIENIPYENESFELCYGRYILEHLDTYKRALKEMFRVAEKAVVITFFKRPMAKEIIEYMPKEKLYHNVYSKPEMENFIMQLDKDCLIDWISPKSKEIILIIKKNFFKYLDPTT